VLGDRYDAVLRRAQIGDADAFAELWRDANPMLLRYLRVTAGPLADDIASHTWLRAVQSLSSFEGTEPGFRRWLVTIARNRHLDEVRRSGRQPEYLTGEVVELVDASGSTASDAAAVAEERGSTAWALRLIATLPRDQAELVMLRVVVGLDVADVAAITDRTPGSVRVSVHRALRKLRDALEPTGETPVTPIPTTSFPDRDA
jgi:RNA polymerase sigma-70 factor (ECF subfamily)